MALTKEEIREGEKVISEFMGYETCTDPDHADDKCYQVPYAKGYHRLHQMQHHASWDWLMPVVEKIEAIDHYSKVKIENNFCEINGEDELSAVADNKIESVWNAVILFIKQYNSQKQ